MRAEPPPGPQTWPAAYFTGGSDTRTVRPSMRTLAWRETVRANQGGLDVGFPVAKSSFAGVTRVQRGGTVQLLEYWSDAASYERFQGAVDDDGDDSLRLLLPFSGEFRVFSAGVVRRVVPGLAVAAPMDRAFRVEQADGTAAFVLTLPRVLWMDKMSGQFPVWELERGNGAVFDAMLREVAAQRASLDADSFARACEAAALVLPRGDGDLYTHARAIARRYADAVDFGPHELADRLGWSLRSVQQALRRAGTTPAELIRGQRLERAATRLTDPAWKDRTISHIAHASGFGSLTAFNVQFRAHFGCSPLDMRNSRECPPEPAADS